MRIALVCVGVVYIGFCMSLLSFKKHVYRSFNNKLVKLFSSKIVRPSTFETSRLYMNDSDGVKRGVNYLDTGIPAGAKDGDLPIVFLAGTAQSISTYIQHLRYFSKNRRLIFPELRGQGQTELLSHNCTMQRHCEDFKTIMDALEIKQVHLVGFSFGGRVGLAIASQYPTLVARLSITGVPLQRTPLGNCILEGWKEGLSEGHIRPCAWSFILNGYSEDFIAKYEKKLKSFVDMIVLSNNAQKVHDLIAFSHVPENDTTFSIPACVSRVMCDVQVIAATQDRIAGFQPVRDLANAVANARFHSVDSGHLIPFEQPVLWRNLVLDFLDDTTSIAASGAVAV